MGKNVDELELSFTRPLPAAAVAELFAQTGWAAGRGLKEIQATLEATPITLGVWRGERLVAMARVLTDHQYRALIDDVIVDQSFRGLGVGSRMMTLLADRLSQVEEVFLRCDRGVVPFYQRLGYRPRAVCLDLDREAGRPR